MKIRPLGAADRPAVARLADVAEREGFRFLRRLVPELAQGTVRLDSPREFFLGAFSGRTLLALGGVTPDPYIGEPDVGRLRHVYVAAPERGRGLGATLVAALEHRARGSYVRLRLRTDTASAARFYEGLGYVVVADPAATHERRLSDAADRTAT